MNFLLLFFLSSVSVVDAPDPKVIGSHEPVNATVGDDVILPCHLDPPFDVNTLTVEWTCNNNNNKTFVHVFRHRKDNPELQDENFKERTSLFHDEMVNGNISLKLTNVTEQDAGKYSCFVPKLHSQVRRGFINLIVEPAEERNKGNQTNNPSGDTGTSQMSSGAITGITAAVVVAAISLFAVLWLIVRRRNMAEHRQEYEMAQRNE